MTSSGSDDFPVATISNNLLFAVDIFDVYNPKPDVTGPLQYKLLATIPAGKQSQDVNTIHDGSQLQAMRTGSISGLGNIYYYQFPVAVMGVFAAADSNTFVITSDMQQSMEQAFLFIKYVQANPNTKTATDFATALGTTGDVDAQQTAVDTFFQNTGSFSKATMFSWTSVFSWQAQFTNPWQGTYYLYTLGDASTAPVLVATLVISSDAKTNTAVLTNPGNQHVNVIMAGDSTMQDSNPGADSLTVALTPTWMNVPQASQVNGQTVTTYALGAAFAGTINGQKVAGNLNQQTLPPAGSKSLDAAAILSVVSFSLNNLFQIAGLLTSVGMLYYMGKGHKEGEKQKENDARGKAKTKTQDKEAEDSVKSDYNAKEVPKVKGKAAEVLGIRPTASEAYKDFTKSENMRKQLDTAQTEIKELRKLLMERPSDPGVNSSAKNLKDVETDVTKASSSSTDNATRETLSTNIDSNMELAGKTLKTEATKAGSNLPETFKNSMEKSSEVIKQTSEQTKSRDTAEANRTQSEKNEPSDPIPKEELDAPKMEAGRE